MKENEIKWRIKIEWDNNKIDEKIIENYYN
jgi:hypothetical protein